MTKRIDYAKASPDGYKAFGAVYMSVLKSDLPKQLIDLVYLRVSQMNGCAFCIDMHTQDLVKQGLTTEKLALVSVWRESGAVFTAAERTALTWAESVTLAATSRVPDADYHAVTAAFSEKEVADLTYAIVLMNAFNRLGIAFRTPPAAAAA